MRVIERPAYSGPHQIFLERVLAARQLTIASGIEEFEHSDAEFRCVAADPNAIAYVGASYIDASVNMILIATSTQPPVAPTEATIRDGSYPSCRPRLMYSRGSPFGASADFLRFALSPDGHEIFRRCGFVPSSVTTVERTGGALTDAASRCMRRITFDGITSYIHSEEMALVREAVECERVRPRSRLIVSGHADVDGTEADNVRVALERARTASVALIRLGVRSSSITTESRGSTAPIARTVDEAGRARNRSVNVVVESPR